MITFIFITIHTIIVSNILFYMLYDALTDYDIIHDGIRGLGRSNCQGCGLSFCLKQRYKFSRYLCTDNNFIIDAWCKSSGIYEITPILVLGGKDYKYFSKLDTAVDWLLTHPDIELESAIRLTKLKGELNEPTLQILGKVPKMP